MNPGINDSAIVYLLDDDASVRAAVDDLLASVGLAVRSFASAAEFWQFWQSDGQDADERPACLVLDIRMPGQSGMEFRRQMLDQGVQLPTIFITGHGDIRMGVEAMKTGAIEFLTKPFRDQDLIDAIQQGIARDRLRRAGDLARQQTQARWLQLSRGEQDVVRLVVRGWLNKQIAAELSVSEITVKVRRAQAMRKMEADSLADLVRMYDRLG